MAQRIIALDTEPKFWGHTLWKRTNSDTLSTDLQTYPLNKYNNFFKKNKVDCDVSVEGNYGSWVK